MRMIPTTVSFSVADVETAASSLNVSGSSSNTNLVPSSSLVFAGTGSSRTVTILPATNQFGSTTITLTVRDSDGGTGSATFLLTVNPVNDVPVLDAIADQVTDEDVAQTVAVRIGDAESPSWSAGARSNFCEYKPRRQ